MQEMLRAGSLPQFPLVRRVCVNGRVTEAGSARLVMGFSRGCCELVSVCTSRSRRFSPA